MLRLEKGEVKRKARRSSEGEEEEEVKKRKEKERGKKKRGKKERGKKKRMMCLDGGQCGESVYGWMGKDGVQERTAEDVYQ